MHSGARLPSKFIMRLGQTTAQLIALVFNISYFYQL